MRYGKISEAIWNDERFQELSDRSKLLYIYLLSCQNCTCIGILQIGMGVIEDEFCRDRTEIRDSIQELKAAGLIGYQDRWMWFNKYLRWNMPLSPNHTKQCAATLHEAIIRNAPAEAIWAFLGSARQALSLEKYQAKDGKKRSYWDDFKAACDIGELHDCLGGSEKLEACLAGKKYPEDKGSASTFKTSTDEAVQKPFEGLGKGASEEKKAEGLNKGLASPTEAVRTQTRKQTRKQTSNQTRPVPTRSLSGVSNVKQQVITFPVMCSDGTIHDVNSTALEIILQQYPHWDMEIFKTRVQSLTLTDPQKRPDSAKIDDFILSLTPYFDGDALKLPADAFFHEKREITSPLQKNATVEAF